MKVINFWAGPGAGKSTTAAGLFYLMKTAGMKCELVTEFAKELVYENNPLLQNNLQILAEQDRRLRRLRGVVDFAITDCPLPIAAVYSRAPFDAEWFRAACWSMYDMYDNIDVFVERVKQYQNYGRQQTEDEARVLDERISEELLGMSHMRVVGDANAPHNVLEYVLEQTA